MKRAIIAAFCFTATLLHGQTVSEGIAALDAGRLDDAVRILSESVRLNPESSEAQFYLGLAQFRAGRPAAARPHLERATALSPENAQAWKLLGLVSTSAGDIESAAVALGKACDLAPKDEEACYYLGRNLYALGRHDAAREPFEKALAAATPAMLAKVHRAIALNLAAAGSPAEAEQHFLKSIQLAGHKPRDAEDPRVDYGAFLFRQGRTQEALRPLEQAVRDVPSNARANLELGRVLLHLDKAADAAARLEKAVELEPANFNAHLLLGRAYMRLGRTKEGEREMQLVEKSWGQKRQVR